MSNRLRTVLLVLVSALSLAACESGTTLTDASAPGCPAEPSSLSGTCTSVGLTCSYRSSGCPSFQYVCTAADGGTEGTWQGLLCD